MTKSILSLSGNRAMSYLLETIINKEFNFIAVENVFQATQKLRVYQNIKFLIVDIDFQPQSWSLIQHIKTSKLYNLPIIVLSSDNNADVRNKCYEFGVDEIFFKPFDPLDIVASIKNTVRSANYIKVIH
jgi:DNA-binding response OmpR family regulator